MTGELIYYIGQNPTGRNLNDLIPDDQAADIISSARQGEEYSFECTIDKCLFSCKSRQADQEIKITMFPINDPREVFINKSTAELIAGEMNDSLHLMRMYLKRMVKYLNDEEAGQAVEVLNQQMFRMTRLARNLHDTAMWVNGALTINYAEHDIAKICNDLAGELRPLLESAGIILKTDIPRQPVICHLDREKVERMILNLIANSMKALEGNRFIELALTIRENGFAITVSDHGKGSDMDEVFAKTTEFDPTVSSGWKGAGFGIALVRAYAKSHGGAFVITSKPGGVTVARITMPYNLGRELTGVNELVPQYGGGLSQTLTELSTALGREHYRLEPPGNRNE